MNVKTKARKAAASGGAHTQLCERMTDAEYARLLTVINDLGRLYAKYEPAPLAFHVALGQDRRGVIVSLKMEGDR
jgi:hypothetical protein